MILNIFVVHDVKAEAYLQPFFFSHDAEAKRAFSDCVNNVEHQFGKHPQDYTLFKIGSFDDSNAQILVNQSNLAISLGNGVEFVENQSTEPQNVQVSNEDNIREDTNS